MNKNLVKGIIVGAVVLVAVIGWSLRRPANSASFPEGTDWLCTSPQCSTGFNLSIKQLADYNEEHAGERIKCPKCGTAAIRAEKCQHCAKHFPMVRDGPHRCPFCGKDNAPAPVG